MTRPNRWALAVGAAGALAFAGTAWAQSQTTTGAPQDSSRAQEKQPGERSGGIGHAADRQGGTGSSAAGTERSAGASSGQPSSAGSPQATQGRQGAQRVDKGLAERLEKIHASNQAEQHMAQMGAQRAQSSEVKQYAQTIQQDHERMDQELQRSAQQAGIQLEGKAFQGKREDATKDMKKLEEKQGSDFDSEFMSRMVKGHKKGLKEVQKAAKDARKQNQAELASMLDQAATGIQGHLEQARRIEKSLDQGRQAQGRRGETGAGRTSTGDSGSAGTTSSPSGAVTPPPSAGSGAQDSGTGTQPQGSGSPKN